MEEQPSPPPSCLKKEAEAWKNRTKNNNKKSSFLSFLFLLTAAVFPGTPRSVGRVQREFRMKVPWIQRETERLQLQQEAALEEANQEEIGINYAAAATSHNKQTVCVPSPTFDVFFFPHNNPCFVIFFFVFFVPSDPIWCYSGFSLMGVSVSLILSLMSCTTLQKY